MTHVVKKVIAAFACLSLSLALCPAFPKLQNVDREFIASTAFPARVGFLLISVFLSRFRYYFAWLLGEAVNNASGLGFNGFDSKGKQKWDLVRNVDVIGVETATSWKEIVENWNTQTAAWLKTVCYQRVPVSKTLATYALSAVWHGFYPGYYFSFLSAVFATLAARNVRRRIRPFFLSSRPIKRFYDIITWFCAQLTLAYLVVPFTAWEFWPIMNFYHNSMYWFLHVILVLIVILLPSKSSSRGQTGPGPSALQANSSSGILNEEPCAMHCGPNTESELKLYRGAADGVVEEAMANAMREVEDDYAFGRGFISADINTKKNI